MKILMVCLGNICRSPLAEGILKNKSQHLNIQVESAGTAGYHIGNPPDIRSVEIANEYGVNLNNQRARQFTKTDFKNFDIIYAMDKQNYADIISLASNQKEREKVRMILNEVNPGEFKSVPDPYYGGENGFKEVYEILNKACKQIILNIE